MNAERPLRVVLVEDHMMVRDAVRSTLERGGISVVGAFGSAEDALEKIRDVEADVALIDIDLPGMSGIQLVQELAPRLPRLKIVMLTGSGNDSDLLASVRNGAIGYLTKDIAPDALLRSLYDVRDGNLPMSRRHAAVVVQDLGAIARARSLPTHESLAAVGLTAREEEVVRLLTDGLSDREIGESLGISPRTVGRHVGSLLEKLQARNRAEAARKYRAMVGRD